MSEMVLQVKYNEKYAHESSPFMSFRTHILTLRYDFDRRFSKYIWALNGYAKDAKIWM